MTNTQFDVNTVYLTEEGREALVVLGGDEHAPASTYQPLRDSNGGIRIAYLAPDGTELPLLETEYAFYAGVLTPHRPLDAPAGK